MFEAGKRMEKDKIDWHFAPEWYKSLNNSLDQARWYLASQYYEEGYRVLKYIYLGITSEIEGKDAKINEKLAGLYKEIEQAIREYQDMTLRLEYNPSLGAQSQLSQKKWELERKADDFYETLTNMLIRLDMIFPKKKIDERKEIFKSGG